MIHTNEEILEAIEEFAGKPPLKLNPDTIRTRMRRGWTRERATTESPTKGRKPAANHPLKRASYQRMATEKGWRV